MLLDRGAITADDDGVWHWVPDRSGEIVLPQTIQGVLQARLDSLQWEQKSLLKHAAVVGRVFWQGALETMAREAGIEGVGRHLDQLEARELLDACPRSSLEGEREVVFRSQAFRDVVYRSIPLRSRQELHRRVAGWLASRGELWDAGRAQIAAHHTAGGVPEEGRHHLLAAARQAEAVHEYAEAVAFYEQALADWPDGLDLAGRMHARRELAIVLTRLGRFDDARGGPAGSAGRSGGHPIAQPGDPPGSDGARAGSGAQRVWSHRRVPRGTRPGRDLGR